MIIQTHELAWAAGFFDGEGNICLHFPHKDQSASAILAIKQIDRRPLDRFNIATLEIGKVYGPYTYNYNKNPYFRYTVCGVYKCQIISSLLYPWLSEPKREQITKVLLIISLPILTHEQCIFAIHNQYFRRHSRTRRLINA